MIRHLSWWTAGAVAMSLLVSIPANAQGTLPKDATYDIFFADTGVDSIYRLADFNQNGTYNEAGDITLVYNDVISGGPDFTNPSSVCLDSRGRLYVSDTGTDAVWVLLDKDGDGDANNGANLEYKLYFDQFHAPSPYLLGSILEIRMDVNNVMWGVSASTSSNPYDIVFRAEDTDGDGVCFTPGEVTIAYDSAIGPHVLGVPFSLAIHPDNPILYVADVNPDVIYRMVDGNLDGDFHDSQECVPVYDGTQPGQPGLSNAGTLTFAPNGDLYVAESLLDKILVLRDGNFDNDFHDPGESWAFADRTVNSLGLPYFMQGIEVDEFGRVIGTESGSSSAGINDSITMFEDKNGDGDADDPGETWYIYDDAVGIEPLSSPKEIVLIPRPKLSTPSSTISVGGGSASIFLDFEGVDSDQYQLLIGLNSLGADFDLQPHGYISQDIVLILPPLTHDATGKAQWILPVPATVPTPLTVYMTQVSGKLPYRYYLSNGIAVNFVP